jgi:hypothetical protein
MKLIFRQYLASLRERGELDAILPDLLSELGYTVISRPSGGRQFGVDVAALGQADKGKRKKLYLFSIKRGDLTRANWDDSTPQALRKSINEIIDVYLNTRVETAHRDRDVVICLCFGGEIREEVKDNLTQFTKSHTRDGLSFEIWNGDLIAGFLVEGVLREQLVDKTLRSRFQKAVALVDEPEASFTHFAALIKGLCGTAGTTLKQRTTILRQLYICLWVLFIWARDAGNLEAPFQASERALLHSWQMIRADIERGGKAALEIGHVYFELDNLHSIIWSELVGAKILPYAATEHAISVAVNSSSSVDVNLKLFETLGRIAFRGLCLLSSMSSDVPLPEARSDWRLVNSEVEEIAAGIVQLIRSNRTLLTPIADHQSTDIAATLLFLSMMEGWQPAARSYVEEMVKCVTYAYLTHGRYPTIHGDYRSLLEHPRKTDDQHQKEHTAGSTLFPLLSIWASSVGAEECADYLANFATKHLEHCNMQFWFIGPDSEEKLYIGDTPHGMTLCDVPITADGADAFNLLQAECDASDEFSRLSAIRLRHWTILVLACRHYRLPIPPNLWLGLLRQLRANHT